MRRLACVLAPALLTGCGNSTGPVTLTPDDAAEVYVEATIQPYLLAVPLLANVPAPGPVNRSTNCETSGTLAVTGNVSSTTVALSAALDACKIRRFQMTGTITIEGTLTTTQAALNWHGTIVLDGPAQGECWVDIVLTIHSGTQTLTGTVCGADAAAMPDAAKRAGLVG